VDAFLHDVLLPGYEHTMIHGPGPPLPGGVSRPSRGTTKRRDTKLTKDGHAAMQGSGGIGTPVTRVPGLATLLARPKPAYSLV
jgi:hypothetical protein